VGDVLTVRDVEALPAAGGVTGFAAKLQSMPVGSPWQASATGAEKFPREATSSEVATLVPRGMLELEGDAARVKSDSAALQRVSASSAGELTVCA
jgi:hypothetical protein